MTTLDDVLLAADPAGGEVSFRPGAAARLASTTVTTAAVNRRRARRRRTAMIGAGLTVCLALAGASSYSIGGIHTGFFVPQGATENGRAGDEELNLSDPSILDVVRQETAKVDLPPGTTYTALLARYPLPFKDGHGFTGTQQVITNSVQGYASCLWMRDWITHPGRRATDLAFMTANFPSWDTELAHIASSLANGDATPLREYTAVNCRS